MAGAALSGISGLLQGFSNTFVTAKLRKDWQEQEAAMHDKAAKDAADRAATVQLTQHLFKSAEDGTLGAVPDSVQKMMDVAFGPELSKGMQGALRGVIQQNAPKRALIQARTQAQQHFLGPATPGETQGALEQISVPTSTGGGVPPPSVFALGQQPGGAAALETTTDPATFLNQRVQANPAAAKLAFEGKVDTGTSRSQKPTISYHQIRQGDQIITRRTVTHPDGTIEESDVGKGATYKGKKTRPMGQKEIETFASGNSIVQQLDDIEQKIQTNPKLAALINSSGTFWRQLGSDATNIPILKQKLATLNLSEEESDFLSQIARVVNQDIHDFAGKQVTGYEGGRVLQQSIGLGQDPKAFLGRLQQTRRNVLRILGNRAKSLSQAGIEGVPEIVTSRDPAAAKLAASGNTHAKAFLVPGGGGAGSAGDPGTAESEVDSFNAIMGR